MNPEDQKKINLSSRRQFLNRFLRDSILISFAQTIQIKKAYAQFFTTSFWKKRGNIIGGSLFSFGFNTNGELGDSTAIAKSSPVQVGALTNWVAVSSGKVQTTALKTDGTLWSWGKANYLGINAAGVRSSPVQVGTLTSWVRIASGDQGAMGIRADGSMWSWGYNSNNYTLSLTTSSTYPSPVQVGSDTNWSRLALGAFGGLAVKTDNTLWTWGRNTNGRLGLMPTGFNQMWTTTGWSQLVTGTRTGYLRQTDGTLWGWGGAIIGDNTLVQKSSAVQIGASTDWNRIAAGSSHTLATKTDGSLWTWGSNDVGQLGNDVTSTAVSSPIQIGSLTDWNLVAVGNNNSLAIKTNGTLWAWGFNSSGQIGDGTIVNKSSPIQIGTLTNWNKISAFNSHVLATKNDNSLWAWGKGSNGRLGDSTSTTKSSPVQIGTLTDWMLISAGSDHSAAIKTNGTLWIWGTGGVGAIGNSSTVSRSSPVQIGTLTDWAFVHAGEEKTTAIKTNGTLWAWGLNNSGEFMDGTATNKSSPVQIGTATNWSQVASGTAAIIALKNDSSVYGSGDFTGTAGLLYPYFLPTNIASSPTQIGSLTSWRDVYASCSYGVSYALQTNGSLWAWGHVNSAGIGSSNSGSGYIHSPVQVGTGTRWSNIAVFGHGTGATTLATQTDGTLWGWGYNNDGQIGDGTTSAKYSPVQVGSLTDWSKVASGSGHSMAIKVDGTLWVWGASTTGQLGDGTLVAKSSPIQLGTATDWYTVSAGLSHSMAIKNLGH